MNRGIIRNEQRRYSVWAAAPVVSGRGRLPKVALLPLAVLSPHVHLSRLYPRGVVDDAVHDGVGVDAAAEPGMPVLLLELRAEDRGGLPESPSITSSMKARKPSSGFSSSHSSSTSSWKFAIFLMSLASLSVLSMPSRRCCIP